MGTTAAFTTGLAVGVAAGIAFAASGLWLLGWAIEAGQKKRAQAALVSKRVEL